MNKINTFSMDLIDVNKKKMSNANKHQKDEDHLSKYSHDECFNLQS
jgi:hypothetical protein